MAHPELAFRDPLYWIALLVVLSIGPILFLARGESGSPWAKAAAVLLAVLFLPSGCYALIGSACYISGSCL